MITRKQALETISQTAQGAFAQAERLMLHSARMLPADTHEYIESLDRRKYLRLLHDVERHTIENHGFDNLEQF